MTVRMVRYLTAEQAQARAASGREAFFDVLLSTDEGLPVVIADGVAVLRLYDVIDSWGGFWGVSASDVAQALDALPDDVSTVEVHLNSPGGEATEGIAVSNLLRQDGRRVVAIVDGLCASAASMVAMGADELVMAPGAQIMVHEASGGAWGPAAFLAQESRALDHLSDSYAAVYALKAGGAADAWRELMRTETWFSPAEAVAAGLADRVLADRVTADPAAQASEVDTRRFAYAGRSAAPAPRIPSAIRAGDPAAAGSTTRKESTVVDIPTTGLRERLGITDESADEVTILAALDEALAEPEPAPVATLPEGAVAIDSAVLADLQASARDGAEARAHQRAESYASAVEQAVKDGRITPAQRGAAPTAEAKGAGWLGKLHTEGADGVAALSSLAAGLVPVAEIGYSNDDAKPDSAAAIRETPAYKNWS